MKSITLTALALAATALTGCMTVTPEMAAKGCTAQDLGGLTGINVGLPFRIWGQFPKQDAELLAKKAEFESRCGVLDERAKSPAAHTP
jgi:hypothetical protein